MKVGILGSGVVSKSLATGFVKYGHEVMVGSRQPDKLSEWKSEISDKLNTGNFKETADFGEIIVLAVKGTAAEEAIELTGKKNLTGKTILDATNPIADTAPVNGVLNFFTDFNMSLMEKLQKAVPDANFVKCFSSIGSAFMVDPPFESKPTMFVCGNNKTAKQQAVKILDQFGWDVADMGTAEAARAIEPLCILWCIPGFVENNWTHAFKLLKL